MPVEIFLSSSDESSRGEPIIVSDTSEEDAPSPPLANPAPPPFPRLASRKIAFGASTHPHPQKKKRKLLKSQVPVSPKQERVVTSRRIVKVKREDAEEDGLGGQRLPRRRLTGKYRDPLLEEMCVGRLSSLRVSLICFFGSSLPFSLSLRLEEIRLNLQNAPARPVIRTALAFRHVTQSAKTALRGPSATVSIPLRPPSSGTSMTSTAIPSPLSLRVVRNPAIPIKPPDPASLDYRPPDNLGELAEVLLLLSIRDAALPSTGEPYYTVTLPISKDRRFQLSGERTTKRAADGTQVTVSWKAELEREGYGYAEPTEEEIEVFVEREMKVVEQEWRREVAERALVRFIQFSPAATMSDHLAIGFCRSRSTRSARIRSAGQPRARPNRSVSFLPDSRSRRSFASSPKFITVFRASPSLLLHRLRNSRRPARRQLARDVPVPPVVGRLEDDERGRGREGAERA